jgi:hypothetical protein
MNDAIDGLKNLQEPSGAVPRTRARSASSLQGMLRSFINNDQYRAYKRSRVQGIVDGNPPYSPTRLRELGRADACNVNWQTAHSYLNQAEGIFYDLFSEAPTFFTITTSYGSLEEQAEWSGKMTNHAHHVVSNDPRWDWLVQMSQQQMTLQGCGPLWFEDCHSVMPRWCRAGDLHVPDNAESETSYWEEAFAIVTYKVTELYDFIADPEAALKVGWDVEYTRKVIMNASPERFHSGLQYNWEWFQQQFKQGSWNTYYDTDVVKLAHVYWREFDGRISHAIIERDEQGSAARGNTPKNDQDGATRYLFFRQGQFGHWGQCVHPMYYDKGCGTHYSVSGLGVRMYGALNYENRLRCNMADQAMAPKLLFRPTQESNRPFSLKPMGNYSVMPAGFDLQQFGFSGMLEDGLLALNEISRTTSANLAQYRQGLSRTDQGNPLSATEVTIRQQQQYAVAGTSISRYYRQLDQLYQEIVRRLCNLNSNDGLALKFQELCWKDGIPKEAIGRVCKVEANRVAGQGSSGLRQAMLDKLMSALSRLPEEGQDNLMERWIAAHTGERSVRLFYPTRRSQKMGNEQEAEAMLQVASMKVGTPPVVTSEQNPVIFATTFMGAAAQALGSLGQGANAAEVYQFVELALPSALAHMQRFANDPTRQGIFKALEGQYQQAVSIAEKLGKHLEEQAGQAQGPDTSGLPPEIQQQLAIEAAKGQLKLQQMRASHEQRLQQRAEQHQMEQAATLQRTKVETAATDLRTAGEIRREGAKASAERPV